MQDTRHKVAQESPPLHTSTRRGPWANSWGTWQQGLPQGQGQEAYGRKEKASEEISKWGCVIWLGNVL